MKVREILENVDILWDGEIAVVVNKPVGLATQAAPGVQSLESLLHGQLGPRGDYLAFPHRLDRPVGGLILVALRKKAARLLSEQFVARKIVKEYHAIVSGRVAPCEQRWSDYLTKIPDLAQAEIADAASVGAKLAETRIAVVKYDAEQDQTQLRMFPLTGRMHQLRVQAARRGHPIVGDTRYGGEGISGAGIMLRAHSLTFFDPRNGARVTVTGSDELD